MKPGGQPQGHVPIAAAFELSLTGFGGPVREYQCPGDPWWPKPVESGGHPRRVGAPRQSPPPTKARRDYATHRHFSDTGADRCPGWQTPTMARSTVVARLACAEEVGF